MSPSPARKVRSVPSSATTVSSPRSSTPALSTGWRWRASRACGGTTIRSNVTKGRSARQAGSGSPFQLDDEAASRSTVGFSSRSTSRGYFASFARMCASMSSVMRERSHSGFQPHSSRAQVSSSELGQLSAISRFTGSMS